MIPSVRFQAVLDTNVIYPLISRDLLFWFAHYDLYTPKWSKHIFDECEEVMVRKGLNQGDAAKRIAGIFFLLETPACLQTGRKER